MGIQIIVKRSEREIRERAHESAPKAYRGHIDGYARGLEEADRLMVERGRDNPANRAILVDDGGKADRELRDRALRNAGIDPGSIDHGE